MPPITTISISTWAGGEVFAADALSGRIARLTGLGFVTAPHYIDANDEKRN
jgi:hypothetical protein